MNLKKIEYPQPPLEKAMAALASAIADPSRLRILCALMDGRVWTATELSCIAEIAPSTTSGHLARLLENKLIFCLSQGRNRYYSLNGHEIAGLLENMMGVTMHPRRKPACRTPSHLRYARTCYDHLAGEVAVSLYENMLSAGWLEHDGSALTPAGQHYFHALGATLNSRARRKACCACLDWSERRFHLGGEAGAALLRLFLEKEWLSSAQGYREVAITPKGKTALRQQFGLTFD